MGKVGPSSPYVTMKAAIVGKLWLWGNGVLNIREKRPFPFKMSLFWVGYVFLLCSRGPKSDLGCAETCGVYRAVPRLAAHMLGYAGKTLVRWKMGETVPFALSFQ